MSIFYDIFAGPYEPAGPTMVGSENPDHEGRSLSYRPCSIKGEQVGPTITGRADQKDPWLPWSGGLDGYSYSPLAEFRQRLDEYSRMTKTPPAGIEGKLK